MASLTISKISAGLKTVDELSQLGKLFADDSNPASRDLICGKLQYQATQGDSKFHKVISGGCVWIYLTDGSGTNRVRLGVSVRTW
jgi:hypothetical protein